MSDLSGRLGARLGAVAAQVLRGAPMADIGTDHGRLPVTLVKAGVVPWAVATDLRAKPLSRAQGLVSRARVNDLVALRQGPGLTPLAAGEVATVVMAGMGADVMREALERTPPAALGIRRLVLQPNQGLERLRRWLFDAGWSVPDESLVEERGRRYTTLCVALKPPPRPMDEVDVVLGPRLREAPVEGVWRAALEVMRGDAKARLRGLRSAKRADETALKEASAALEVIEGALGLTGA